jgi:UDP-2,3-diacylglucosamine pyrophosphatase LpxH
MKKYRFVFPLVCLLFSSCIPIGIETFPDTDEDQVRNLMDIHYQIAKTIDVVKQDSRFIFLGDFHRGYGEFDKFHFNEELYCDVLMTFLKLGYTLVLMGDIEEGWGFQKNNISLIQKFHEKAIRAEEEFVKAGRYYRVYGNHDDFLRGNFMNAGGTDVEVLSAIKIHLTETEDAKSKVVSEIFVTHGSQGHGLHDAGDELAAWVVFMKYNYLQNAFFKRQKALKEGAKKIGYSVDRNLKLGAVKRDGAAPPLDPRKLKKLEEEANSLKNEMNSWILFHGYDSGDSPFFPASSGRRHTLGKEELLDVKGMGRIAKEFTGHEKIVLEWAKERNGRAIDTMILGHTHVAVFNSKVIQIVKDQNDSYLPPAKRGLLGRYFMQDPSQKAGGSGGKFQYHNTGAVSGDAIPCLVLTGGQFEYYFFRRMNDGRISVRVITSKRGGKVVGAESEVSKEYDLSELTEEFAAGKR